MGIKPNLRVYIRAEWNGVRLKWAHLLPGVKGHIAGLDGGTLSLNVHNIACVGY